MFKKFISTTALVAILCSMNTGIANASDSIPKEMPFLKIDGQPIRNSFAGDYWLGQFGYTWRDKDTGAWINNQGSGGVYQWRYIDHIDVRIDNAYVDINQYENGVYQETNHKEAKVTHVSNVIVTMKDGSTRVYAATLKREDTVHHVKEFNAQIAPLNTFNLEKEWLDLTQVEKITVQATLTAYNNDDSSKNYDIEWTVDWTNNNIVTKSDCSNASGVDYYIGGDVTNNVVIITPPPEEPVIPEPEPSLELPDAYLVPSTGDYSIILNTLTIALSSLILITKKR